MKKVQNDINEYEKSIQQLEDTANKANISSLDILDQFNQRIATNKRTLAYIKTLMNEKGDEKKLADCIFKMQRNQINNYQIKTQI